MRRSLSAALTTVLLATAATGPVLTGALTTSTLAAEASPGLAPYTLLDDKAATQSVAIGDLTHDGLPDLVAASTPSGATGGRPRGLLIYARLVDGSLATTPEVVPIDATNLSFMSLRLGDLDGDGDLDAVVGTENGALIFEQQETGLPVLAATLSSDVFDLQLADMNADGLVDVVLDTLHGAEVWSRLPESNWSSYGSQAVTDYLSLALAVGDVTGDGRPDVVTSGRSTDTAFQVIAQTGVGGYAPGVDHPHGAPTSSGFVSGLAVGDTDGDGKLDVHVSVTPSTGTAGWVVTHRQLAGGTLEPSVVRTSAAKPSNLVVADVTGDGHQDLVVRHATGDRDDVLGVYDSTPGTAGSERLYPVLGYADLAPANLAVGDVSGDGRPDVVLANRFFGPVVLRGAEPGADITTPETTLTSGPPNTLRSRSATFAFTSDDPSTFECSMDHGAWSRCSSPATYDSLTSQGHYFQVRATDAAGNTDPSPATSSFVIPADIEPPTTTISSGPSGLVTSRTASFAFTANEPATFECSLDASAFARCGSPRTFDGLAAGAHTFVVRAADTAGNVEATPGSRSFTVEGADLSPSLTASTASPKKGTVLTLTGVVANAGPTAARELTVRQSVPADLTGVTMTSPQGTTACTVASGTATCTLPSLASGATWTTTLRGTVLGNKGTLSSTASVSSGSWDPNGANDSATVTLKVGNGQGN